MPFDRRILAKTSGRLSLLGPFGIPMLLLTTKGHKSGAVRVSPLGYFREGDNIYVAGTNFGQDHHPAWTVNLLAEPLCEVAVCGRRVRALATLVASEPERTYALAGFNDAVGVAASYRLRTSREPRVFRLTAVHQTRSKIGSDSVN
ncbi:nitroreductase/quinone reductase family protein [Mycobacteroides abscessus]|uniref:nitroreductase/quinone reductase family protein n=1 Tax=Mycobacteroides abscessus TaxID=36809 RepID=UPI00355BF194